jgi:hypothetical protein
VKGRLRGHDLDKALLQAANEQKVAEFCRGIRQPVEHATIAEFESELRKGAANAILDALRPEFTASADELVRAAEVIDPNVDAVKFLEKANPKQRAVWNSIQSNVDHLNRIISLAVQFGPKSQTFPLIELPQQAGSVGFMSDVAVMCVHPRYSLVQASAAFSQPGTHRQSPLFRCAGQLNLNSVQMAAETVRAWAEQSWESLGLNVGRGRLAEDGKTFIPQPIRNPYAKESV